MPPSHSELLLAFVIVNAHYAALTTVKRELFARLLRQQLMQRTEHNHYLDFTSVSFLSVSQSARRKWRHTRARQI